MSVARERRVKRVYRYNSGLMVMVFEDGKDAILFDPPRLTLWTFENADEAFKFAKNNKIPMGSSVHVTESLPQPPAASGVGEAAAIQRGLQTIESYKDGPRTVATVSKTAMESKKHVRHDSPENFVPIDSIAFL